MLKFHVLKNPQKPHKQKYPLVKAGLILPSKSTLNLSSTMTPKTSKINVSRTSSKTGKTQALSCQSPIASKKPSKIHTTDLIFSIKKKKLV
jgi:hypothetical protein